jgi:hypothetical protein
MQVYCGCGYPIRIGTQRDGAAYLLALYDGVRGDARRAATSSTITRCPHCGRWLRPTELAWQAPPHASAFPNTMDTSADGMQ